MLATGQLRCQSVTAPGYATHTLTADLSELINVMNWFRTHVAECLQRVFIPVSRYVKENPSRFSRVMITNVLPRFFHILRVDYECEMSLFHFHKVV